MGGQAKARLLAAIRVEFGEDLPLEEIYMKDGELYAKAFDDDEETEIRLYPVGEDEFGIKDDWRTFRFGENCICYDDMTCRYIET